MHTKLPSTHKPPAAALGVTMSIDAIKWARVADVKRSSSKLILMNLAMMVRYGAKEWTVFASIDYLAKITHLNRKTVMDALARLRELGAIHDTGRRAGGSRASIIYRLCPAAVPMLEAAPGLGSQTADDMHEPERELIKENIVEPTPDGQGQQAEEKQQSGSQGEWMSLAKMIETSAAMSLGGQCVPVACRGPASGLPQNVTTQPSSANRPSGAIAVPTTVNASPRIARTLPEKSKRPRLVTPNFERRRRMDPSAGSGATRLPAGWLLPEAWRKWTQQERSHWPASKIDSMAATFTAYMRSRPGDDGMSHDWFESWRLWVFREREGKAPRKEWHTYWSGIVAKGKTLGLIYDESEPAPNFKHRVFEAAGMSMMC